MGDEFVSQIYIEEHLDGEDDEGPPQSCGVEKHRTHEDGEGAGIDQRIAVQAGQAREAKYRLGGNNAPRKHEHPRKVHPWILFHQVGAGIQGSLHINLCEAGGYHKRGNAIALMIRHDDRYAGYGQNGEQELGQKRTKALAGIRTPEGAPCVSSFPKSAGHHEGITSCTICEPLVSPMTPIDASRNRAS